MEKPRTDKQNNAMHKWFDLYAEALNDCGLDQRTVLKPEISIPWTKTAFKEQIWKPIQKLMYHTDSTTDLTTEQVTKIQEVINREMGEKHGMFVEFPSIETIMIKMMESESKKK